MWTKDKIEKKIAALKQQAQECFNDGHKCLGAIQALNMQLEDFDKPEQAPEPAPAPAIPAPAGQAEEKK
jgi:hypothetical protein